MKKIMRTLTGCLAVLCLAAGLIAQTAVPVKAETWTKTKDNTGLGTGAISDPTPGRDDPRQPWVGNYVYFGRNGNDPVKYRVLSKDTTDFSKKEEGKDPIHTMLLDCDTIFDQRFDGEDPYSNQWSGSPAQSWLNGTFLSDYFTAVEQSAIAESTKEDKVNGDGPGYEILTFTPLTGEKIFLLDSVEVTRGSYGYSLGTTGGEGEGNGRIKNGAGSRWWLRSPNTDKDYYAGCVNNEGYVLYDIVDNTSVGVSPAFNINLSSVLFASVISGTAGEAKSEYKLTLKDKDLKITADDITRDGNEITVKYAIDGDNKKENTKAVILITDKEYTDSGAVVKYYEELEQVSGGVGKFTLPSGYQDTWKTYLLAENRNGEKETDYASGFLSVEVPKLIAASAEDVETAYDGKAHGIKVTVTEPESGATVKYGTKEGSYTLDKSPEIIDVKDSKTIYYQVTAADYPEFTDSATVTITKADQDAPAAPEAEKATSTSIKLQEIKNGEYKCGDGEWQDSPSFTGLKKDTEYTFSQRLKADDNHNASPAASAKISTAKTYKVTYEITGEIPDGAPKAPEDKNEYEEKDEVTVKDVLTMEGYTFSGWNSKDVSPKDGKFAMPAKDVTLGGSWKVNQHVLTVRYEYADGKKAAEPYKKNVDYGAEYAVASPEIKGYTASQKTVKGTMGDKDESVKVTYGVNTHTLTVSYKYTDGKKAYDTHTENLDYGVKYTVKSPEITGYTADQATVTGTMSDQDVSVDVVYTAKEYILSFNTDGGSEIKSVTLAYGAAVKAPADPAKDGYTFSGWDPALPAAMPAEDMTVKAKWTKVKEPEPETKPEPEPEPEKKVSGTLLTRMTAKGNKSLVLTWSKVKGAEGYDIFFTGCGTTLKNKVVRKIKGNKTFTWTKKKLLKGKKYKAYVKAWVKKDGKKTYVKKSPAVHAFTANGNKKYTNPKSITVKKKKITLKAGKSYTIKTKINKIDEKKSLMKETHGAALRYCSSNTKIARVSSKGKITAKAPGKCKVYVYAINGVSKTIRVTVKEK